LESQRFQHNKILFCKFFCWRFIYYTLLIFSSSSTLTWTALRLMKYLAFNSYWVLKIFAIKKNKWHKIKVAKSCPMRPQCEFMAMTGIGRCNWISCYRPSPPFMPPCIRMTAIWTTPRCFHCYMWIRSKPQSDIARLISVTIEMRTLKSWKILVGISTWIFPRNLFSTWTTNCVCHFCHLFEQSIILIFIFL